MHLSPPSTTVKDSLTRSAACPQKETDFSKHTVWNSVFSQLRKEELSYQNTHPAGSSLQGVGLGAVVCSAGPSEISHLQQDQAEFGLELLWVWHW